MPIERNQSLESAVQKLVAVMKVCTDDQFCERIDIMNKLCEIWANGEDVDLRCNEPEEMPINDINQTESQSVETNHVQKTKPIAKYRAPVMPRRKPGEPAVPFDCSVCGKSYRFYSQLQQHSRHHAGLRPFECDICGQSFALQCSLAKHVTIHSNEKPLMCDTCGQRFAHINYLKSHQQTHLRKQPYSCQECDKKFTTAGSLRHHIANTHSESISESPDHQFTCDKCGETFPSLVLVRQHLDTHSTVDGDRDMNAYKTITGSQSHTCSLCGKVLDSLARLRRHMAVHCDENERRCEVCGRQFYQLASLKAHMKSHSDNPKPFACQLCGKHFSDSSTLLRHTSSHSPVQDMVICTETMSLLGDVVTTVSTNTRVDLDSSDFNYGVLLKSTNCV